MNDATNQSYTILLWRKEHKLNDLWVGQIIGSIYVWAQHLVEPKNDEIESLLDPQTTQLSDLLNLEMIGLTTH